jgi:hypothetical protein
MGTALDKDKYIAREAILELLSDEEAARVATAESVPPIEGDEYIDLSDIASGIHQVHGAAKPLPSILPRSAVSDATWTRIVERIG